MSFVTQAPLPASNIAMTTGSALMRQPPCPAIGTVARGVVPCAMMTASPRVRRFQRSAIVRAARFAGAVPGNGPLGRPVRRSNIVLATMPWRRGSAPVAIDAWPTLVSEGR